MNSGVVVTIDGPAGVGKSTVGRAVAVRLRLPFIDTGIFYRALTLLARERGIQVGDAAALAHLAANFDVEINTDNEPGPGDWRARMGGREFDLELWDPDLAGLLAHVSSQGPVRQYLLDLQRRAGRAGAVAVGRDTGTAVFPEALCKFYLDAPPEVRLERRGRELQRRGLGDPAALMAEVVERDRQDMTRSHSPLAIPDGALVIDTRQISAAQVTELILSECRDRGVTPR